MGGIGQVGQRTLQMFVGNSMNLPDKYEFLSLRKEFVATNIARRNGSLRTYVLGFIAHQDRTAGKTWLILEEWYASSSQKHVSQHY
ncbi:hypothetical protein ACFX1X_044286 [Malus domestica]